MKIVISDMFNLPEKHEKIGINKLRLFLQKAHNHKCSYFSESCKQIDLNISQEDYIIDMHAVNTFIFYKTCLGNGTIGVALNLKTEFKG